MWGAPSDNFGGGGFLGSQDGANRFGSPAAQGDKPKARRSNNIVPVTIKQILECQDETLHVEDVEAQVLTIVGLVTAVESSTTKISVHIDDQTGVIEAVNYVGTDSTGSEIPFIPVEGTYGRVVGALRTMKGNKYLVIFKFLPVTDMNELTAHMLEVIQVPMRLKKLKEMEAEKTGVGLGGAMNSNTLPNSIMANNFGDPSAMGGTGTANNAGGGQQKPGSNKSILLNIIQSNKADSGIHKDDIIRNLKGRMTNLKEIDKLLEELSGEGHIYSTIDDDHFKSTD